MLRCRTGLVVSVLLGAAIGASAAGLTPGSSGVPMGQPLDFTVQVRLEADESLTPECLSAEVTLGDRRLSSGQVRTVLDMTGTQRARVRVQTSLTVDEPVVEVQLNANCGSVQMSRRFIVLADPPLSNMAPAAAPLQAVAAPAQALAPVAATAAQTSTAMAAAAPAQAATAAAAPVVRAAANPPTTRASAERPPRTARSAQSSRRADRRQAGRNTPGRTARAALPSAPRAAAQEAPRLRLEAAEPEPSAQAAVIEQAMTAVAQAASAARAAASAAALADARIAGLESDVSALRQQADASRELAAQLRERLVVAEQSGRWTWPLLALVLLLTALAAWLAWRLNAAERARQKGWQAAAAVPAPGAPPATPSKLPTAPIPFVTSELSLPAAPAAARPRPVHAWPAPAPVDTQPPPVTEIRTVATPKAPTAPQRPEPVRPMERTEPLPPHLAIDAEAARDVSIEELIDLEQQAEFFVVLGQDDAAIELLAEHLRHTGGGSPLPYLKLLEIYRRRDEREHYERLRGRFNQRFNAYAPDWGVDLQAGRSLDDYGGVIPRLQQVWARPLDAMAELEALLFRKSRGELFDLPAYREVLFLYSLARDLLDREAANSGDVDLLLPLADGGEFSSTSPAPFITPGRDAGPSRSGFDPHATAPLDFDLSSDGGRVTSIFGVLDEPPARPLGR